MIYGVQSGHLGGSFSAAEIMAAMYFHQLRIDPKNPDWPDRDRFVASKGHCAPVYYAALAQAGFFPKEWLKSFRQIGSRLQGHPDRNKLPGVDMNSGPLGHGLSVGVGLALSGRLRGAGYRTYVLLGDGESQAGIVWEAAMTASKYKVDNLTAILDYNGVQLDGPVCNVMPLEPLVDKWRAFGWHVFEIDGHNIHEILDTLDAAPGIHSKPTMVIAHTVKGKGVSFMENDCAWHGRAPNEEEFERALAELQQGLAR
jgi:transketolase